MSDCKHEEFRAVVAVNRLEDTNPMAFTADVKICCAQCLLQFEFIGFPAGLSPVKPTVSFDGCELRVPIKPSGQAETPLYAGFGVTLSHLKTEGSA